MKYYCIGIKGTGMSTLAQILNDLGHEVSGYDDAMGHKFTQVGLEERNIPIYYDQNHEIDPDTIVTYSVAFREDHKEIQRVKSLGLKIVKYNELMGQITDVIELQDELHQNCLDKMDEVQEKFKDYTISITLDVDISD